MTIDERSESNNPLNPLNPMIKKTFDERSLPSREVYPACPACPVVERTG